MSNKCTECEKNKFVLPYEYFANPLTVVEQGGDWIQGAIKHPGRCTPGSPNYDCPKGSPQWNLAQRFKHGDLHKAQEGGDQQKQIMQVITMYAKIHNVDPQMIVQKLQELDENGQQQAIQTMVAEVQQGAGQMQQQQMQQPQQQETAPMSYADNDESQAMESYQGGGAYGARGAVGFGQHVPYSVPTINALTSEKKGPFGKLLNDTSGILGLVGATAGAALGYGKAAQWIGNKIKPGSNILQNTNRRLGNVIDFSTDLGYNRNRNINNMNNIPAPNLTQAPLINYNKIKNTDFTKQPQYNGEYDTMVAAYGGVLPQAQFGSFVPPNRAPYAQQNNTPDPNEFPQNTTVDASARAQGANAYNQYNNAIRSFGQPFNTDNMTQSELNAFNNNKIKFPKPLIPANEDSTIDESQFAPLQGNNNVPDQYMLDDMQAITEEPNDLYATNPLEKKYIRDARRNNNISNNSFNGMEYAQKSLAGLGAFANTIRSREAEKQQREYEDMLRRTGNTDFGMASNSKNPFGDYTLNVGPANNFQLGMTTPIQDFGTKGYSRYGGQSYAEGGEYQVSEDELLQLMQEGAEIEFINK